MIREIRLYPDPVLREVSKPIKNIDQEARILIQDMIETLRTCEGVGLAAPQVGVLLRVIVIGVDEEPIAIINPEVSKPAGEDLLEEGCLSIPGVQVLVKRPAEVLVEGLSPDGKPEKIQARNLFGRVIQHEVDHLNGILIIDQLSKEENLEFELNYIRTLSSRGVELDTPAIKI